MHRINKTVLTYVGLSVAVIILFCISFNFFSCTPGNNATANILGAWSQETSFDGGQRSGSVLFVIGDKIYICAGYNGNNNTRVYKKDLWEYNSTIDTWIKKKSLPGVGRVGATGFSANGKGYVGLGYDGLNYLNDFWVFEPTVGDSGTWTQIKNFAGPARRGAFAFTINDVGYVGTGSDDNLTYKDFYQYDALNNAWIQKPAVPKIERTNAFSFVINNLGYVGGGSNNGSPVQDLYAYDDVTGTWIQKNDLKDDPYDVDVNDKGYNTIGRESAASFVINGKGYVVDGKIGSSSSLENWEYTPETDTWLKKQSFGFNVQGKSLSALPRIGAVGFSLDGYGYVCCGVNGNLYLNDKWKYDPTAINN